MLSDEGDDWMAPRPEDRTPARRRAKKDWHARDPTDVGLPPNVDLASLCRMAAAEAFEYVDSAIMKECRDRVDRVATRIASIKADIAIRSAKEEERSRKSGRKRTRGGRAIAKLHDKLAEEEARLNVLLQNDEWRDFQLSVRQAAREVEAELMRPVDRPIGVPTVSRKIMIRTADWKQIGPVGVDGWLPGGKLALVITALVEEAGLEMPEVYHFEFNGRPFLGCLERTIAVNGSVGEGGVIADMVSIVPGKEPPRDAMQLAPRVMKAKLMGLLGLERDPGFPGADADCSPEDRDERERERLLGLGICPECSLPLVWMDDSCDKVCEKCAIATKLLDTTFRAAYTEHSSVTKTNYYERRDHFLTLLKEFQGKEGKEVPESVLDDVVVALSERRALQPEQIDADLIRKVLRATGHSNYYKNVHSIMNTLLGIPPPYLTADQSRTMLSRFMDLQEPWNCMTRVEKEGRKNFLNYFYVMRKIAEIEGYTEFVHRFRLLKHDPRLAQYDRIWERLMRKRRWPFIPTVAPSREEVRRATLSLAQQQQPT
jgi:hypothetical protein